MGEDKEIFHDMIRSFRKRTNDETLKRFLSQLIFVTKDNNCMDGLSGLQTTINHHLLKEEFENWCEGG